jgi:hypothetical protein
MSTNRVAELDGRAKLHERNGHAGGHSPNGQVSEKETTAPPSNAVPNGVNGAPSGRDAAGKFLPGNQAARGRGNAFYRRQAGLRQALVEEVGEDGLRRLARKLLDLALAGDVAAARTLLAYAVGKPAAAVNPDEADLDEFRLIRERPSKGEVVLALLDSALPGKVAEALGLLNSDGEAPGDYLKRLVSDRDPLGTAATVKAEREAKRRRRK